MNPRISLLWLVLAAPAAWAAHPAASPHEGDHYFEPSEREAWREGAVRIPDYPDSGDLRELEIGAPGTPFRYFIDPGSVTVGDDGVVRYTIAIRSGSGAENVFYEGLHCAERSYRTYAYGTGDGGLRPFSGTEWQRIHGGRSGLFREHLRSEFLCDALQDAPLALREIRRRIRHPGVVDRSRLR